jgi:N-acetylglucosaminyl-diphospho-decaprenol L-rhamnosyltransferase
VTVARQRGPYLTEELSIVIVTYNSLKEIGACLESLKADPELLKVRCIIVDNCSSDGTYQYLKSNSANCQIVRASRNNGFAAGVNLGETFINTPFFLVINPDVLPKKRPLELMLEAIKTDPKVAALGCRLVYPDGGPQSSCRTFPTVATFLGRALPFGWPESTKYMERHLMLSLLYDPLKSKRDIHKVDWILGGCALFRHSAFCQVGPLDEGYFLYYEDIDWCYRAKKAGWKIGYISFAEMVHAYKRQSKNFSIKNNLTLIHGRSALRFFAKSFRDRGLETLF